jgi:putative oxidoreductase
VKPAGASLYAPVARAGKLRTGASSRDAGVAPSKPDAGREQRKRRHRATSIEGETMSVQSTESSHPLLSHTDSIAGSATDTLLLIGRVLLGWLFLASAWGKLMNMGGYVAYLTNLKVPNPEFWSWIGAPVEFLIGAALILGFATRYAALLCLLFLIVATALAHRYWEYPAAQMGAQYNNFLKNLAIFGGTLLLFVTGPGRLSIDRTLSKNG